MNIEIKHSDPMRDTLRFLDPDTSDRQYYCEVLLKPTVLSMTDELQTAWESYKDEIDAALQENIDNFEDFQEEVLTELDGFLADMDAFKGEVTDEIGTLRDEITTFKGEVTDEITTFKGEVTDEITTFKGEVTDEITTFKGEVTDEITTCKGEVTDEITMLQTSVETALDSLESALIEYVDNTAAAIRSEVAILEQSLRDALQIEILRAQNEEGRIERRLDEEVLLKRGVPNGFATLDNAGKIPADQLTVEIVTYEGAWSAASNSPILPLNGTGIDIGQCWIVREAGTFAGVEFNIGDFIIWGKNKEGDGEWQKIGGSSVFEDAVTDMTGMTAQQVTNLFNYA